MDDPSDLSCKDGTRQHPVDSGEATHNRKVVGLMMSREQAGGSHPGRRDAWCRALAFQGDRVQQLGSR